MNKMKRLIFTLLFLITLSQYSHAWKSAAPSTHLRITDKALQKISETEYPDVSVLWYGRDISDWSSGLSDDSRAHGNLSDGDFNRDYALELVNRR